jgi:hypothetical protein
MGQTTCQLLETRCSQGADKLSHCLCPILRYVFSPRGETLVSLLQRGVCLCCSLVALGSPLSTMGMRVHWW